MTIKQIRKTSQKIREEILSHLEKQPLSVEQLRKNIEDSNWATINKYLEELKKDNLVREIISTGKIKIYQKVMGDTYFDLPITEEQRKKFRTLFSIIINEYKKRKGKVPTKTYVAKCAVDVIKNKEAELEDLPIIWYLYGMAPLMAIDITIDYKEETSLKQKSKIHNLVLKFFNENGSKGSGQIQREQHKQYNEETYILSDEIFKILNKPTFENKEILRLLSKFFIACPVDSEFPEIFDLTERVISIIQKMDLIEISLQDNRNRILLIFDSLWKFIALYKLYKSRTSGPNAMNKDIVKMFYIGNALEEKKRALQESLSELDSEYQAKLSEIDVDKMEISDEVKEVKKIMEEWAGED
jgi:DNA-binding transcriptional ArsR family regulator